MSTPPFLTLPASARSIRLATARGEFAALHSMPPSGSPRGTALLVPGFTGSKEDFIALLEPLTEAGFQVVAVDQRGQYQTGGPADPAAYALELLALDLLAVTEAVSGLLPGATGPLHLLGHSFGGYVVREAVLLGGSTPESLPWSSLTLMSTGPGPVAAEEGKRAELLVSVLPLMDLESIWQAMREMDREAGVEQQLPPEIEDFLHRRWLANIPEALAVTGRQLTVEPDRVDDLAAAGLPTLVLSGEEDYAWPVTEQAGMAERLGAGYVRIPGAGHSPNAEQPGATAAALADFWLSVN
ncbi:MULTISPECIES: alpha/beta fold hydrolase [Streptacidiphilus]|uniref:Alpha/beta fold hydrolase n=1 Tax=Streptacidiphilus cavernicola TaxID=3342716 RepID=A0ABV6V0I2_9ACTN|nr:alpha/beta hydrolase [Streptacidiphilus jeojiense]